ncbi:MAG: PorT family protein [Prevotella sp.]|nr:PorT family protein [Prevotella sp.]
MATVALTASAQNTLRDNGTFTLQPKVGIGIGMLSGEWKTYAGFDNKSRVGLVAGVEGEYYATEWLGIALGLNYAQQGWKMEGNGLEETFKYDYLNVPLTGNFYVAKGLALKTGVQFGFLMSAKVGDADVKDGCEKLNLSIPIGVSYEYGNVVLDLRYNLGLSKTNKEGNDNKLRSDLLQITLGYKFAL